MPTILTEAMRLAHPLAQYIPMAVWDSVYFGNQAIDTELQRVGGTLAEASAPLQPGEQPLKSLLCMFYGHHEVTA